MTASNPPLAPGRRWPRRRPAADRDSQPQTKARRSAQPLHEALAIGLGSDALDHKMIPAPDWR